MSKYKDVTPKPGSWLAQFQASRPTRMKRFPNAQEEAEDYEPAELEMSDEPIRLDSPEFDFFD